ncbi:MAG: division/cell wall cluster transcriptional repressor MraZ [Actinobacteria bacterium]|nr:MAG: division/cell wall cluster transcriptional repressor MraZ [Actinomycetota bacterium]
MLLGEYEHTLDDKNRLTFPARFRQAFSGGLVVTRGMDGCLFVFTQDDWERFVAVRLEGLDPFSKEARQLGRFIFSAAAEAELDKQGRIPLPPALVQHARLGRDVVVAGVRDHVEIWDRGAWREHLKEVEGSAELVAERLAANHG